MPPQSIPCLIRDATEADLPAILAIYNAEVRSGVATFDVDDRTTEENVRWLRDHGPPACAIVAVEPDGDLLGFGSLSRFGSRAGYRFTVEDTVYVRPQSERRGVGRLLLEELIARARSGGSHAVLGRIAGENEPSIALHRACGFVEVGREREVGFKFDRWLDVVTMELLVDA